MKLSEGVEWGVHCAVLLAVLPPGATLAGRDLAAFHGVSDSYLLKHLQALAAAGILESVPGPKGGYRLARAPEEVTLLAMVQAIEGRQPAFRCTEIRQRGPAGLEAAAYPRPCGIHAAMARAEVAWRKELRAVTLADLVAQVQASLDPRAQERAATWLPQHVRDAGRGGRASPSASEAAASP